MKLALAALVAVTSLTAPAFAQSKRYPAPPKDPDREAEVHSKLWEDAMSPGRTPYQGLVHDAKLLVDEHAPEPAKVAREKLDRAVALLPKAPEAYALRGELGMWERKWTACADDFAASELHSPPDDGTSLERTLRRMSLGICEARAGRYSEAERTLVSVTGNLPGRASAWLRLGEVRIAMGKLDEAIGALDTALELCPQGTSCDAPVPLIHVVLASAFDRARRPSEAEAQIDLASVQDRAFGAILAPAYPLVGAGEADYLMALAHRYEPLPKPEYALAHFRRFLKLAPDSPWRRRAEDHVHELASLDYPLGIERRAGTTTPDPEATRAAIAKVMPQMRACMARLPTTVVEVQVTRDGARSPESRDLPRARMLPAGVAVRDVLELESPARADVDAALKCIQPIAERMALPPIKDHDVYYSSAFVVVAP